MRKALLLFVLVASCPILLLAQYHLSIHVADEMNRQVAGATASVAGTLATGQTNRSGNIRFRNVEEGRRLIRVSFLGYKPIERTVTVTGEEQLNFILEPQEFLADEVIVNATRANANSATSYKNLTKEDLAKNNLGQDLPFLLDQTPGVVSYSDAGAGVGYTGLRIRGSDPTRINVTLNGIPYNDSESMGSFFVNLPDFASSVDNIQIQRGVGTSTNGAGAFGASINIQTNTRMDTAYAELDNTYGSFNTWKNTVRIGTGLINDRFTFDGRLSRIQSDGFIDRGSSDLKSFFLSGAWYGKNSLLRANVFSGKERTYQAWNGVPEEKLFGTAEDLEDYIAANGLEGRDAVNIRDADPRRYNSFLYENQHDNYQQDHYQLLYSNNLMPNLVVNGALHYTRGRGYYEEYRPNASYTDYDLEPVLVNGESISRTDLVRQRWLSNHFYGLTYSIDYNASDRLNLTLGGAYNEYKGDHFGDIIWSRNPLFTEREDYDFNADGSFHTNHRYYFNDAHKTDFNVFGKGEYKIANAVFFADLQYRRVTYSFLGYDRNLNNIQQSTEMNFFNPKFGVSYQFANNSNAYVSYAIGNKEPVRDDFENSTPDSRPKAERMQNIELGYRLAQREFNAGINAYAMIYEDQLILTGQINDVGAQTRLNVPDSYRIGIEADVKWQPARQFSWALTGALSRNRIKDFYEYINIYDENWDVSDQQVSQFSNTHIALSPSFVGSSEIAYRPLAKAEIALISKYVSRQYLDNTSNVDRSLDAFFVNNLRLSYNLAFRGVKNLGISLLVNNLFNEKYESNGYTYSSIFQGDPTVYASNFYFPQAGTNFLLGLNVKF
ncbi:TonB-dependent receptor [Olivibacter sp. SDN3]|uniref:TonB-dependent receptor n=1 Tax=Olivibacter sp. SDN3 TaxID=2764720 RepID=UPI0016519485|nr:TonB-dependent receptor [Olivibacter sp. SDN3]QNL51002.1 TonB-dependent receptor [Olivibacter sp. SDN3]